MNRTDSPKKQPIVFGVNGPREPLLPTTPAGDNTASYEQGFPPITMILKSAGGLPPKGQDMNQILFELSALARWSSAGVLNTYDADFALSIGGYPSGAYVLGDDLSTIYRCYVNGNTGNPNASTIGWTKLSSDIATDLGLKSAAYKNVGTSPGQIPDMSEFTSSIGISGWAKIPSGLIMQWGTSAVTSAGNTTLTFPIAFPVKLLSFTTGYQQDSYPTKMQSIIVNATLTTNLGVSLRNLEFDGTTIGGSLSSFFWFAIGY